MNSSPNISIVLDMAADFVQMQQESAQMPTTFSEVKTNIPNFVKDAAAKGLKLRSMQTKSNQCCLPIGLARANQLINNDNLSLSTLKRMKSFAARHGSQLKADTPENSKLVQALLIWGIPASKPGIAKFIAWVDREIAKKEAA